jgi:membrane protein
VLHYIKHTLLPSKPGRLIIQTGKKWQQDECSSMGAALSYYALFSLFPICLVVLSVTGFLLGPETDALAQLIGFIKTALPPGAVAIVEETLFNLNRGSAIAGWVGFFLLLLTASSVFGVLAQSVNKIWSEGDKEPKAGGIRTTAIAFIVEKLTAFGLVLLAAALLLLSLLSNIVIRVMVQLVEQFNDLVPFLALDNLLVARSLQLASSVFTLYLAVLLLLRVLPPAPMPWKDIWPAALLTVSLLFGLQQLVSYGIIEIGGQYQSYGVIGGVMILMAWIYLTCQIFFLGCEFAYVYARLFGSRRYQVKRD